MASVTLKGNPFSTTGDLPALGAAAPAFTLTGQDLGDFSSGDFRGKRVVLNVFPSIDTPICATSVRKFNELASRHPDSVVVCVSADLPFAAKRFCGAEGLDRVVTGSTFRQPAFGRAYGLELAEGPLKGLLARAVVVIGQDGAVRYTELVPEIGQEPDYDSALGALN